MAQHRVNEEFLILHTFDVIRSCLCIEILAFAKSSKEMLNVSTFLN